MAFIPMAISLAMITQPLVIILVLLLTYSPIKMPTKIQHVTNGCDMILMTGFTYVL